MANRVLYCARVTDAGAEEEIVEDGDCGASPKPTAVVPCNTHSCPARCCYYHTHTLSHTDTCRYRPTQTYRQTHTYMHTHSIIYRDINHHLFSMSPLVQMEGLGNGILLSDVQPGRSCQNCRLRPVCPRQGEHRPRDRVSGSGQAGGHGPLPGAGLHLQVGGQGVEPGMHPWIAHLESLVCE